MVAQGEKQLPGAEQDQQDGRRTRHGRLAPARVGIRSRRVPVQPAPGPRGVEEDDGEGEGHFGEDTDAEEQFVEAVEGEGPEDAEAPRARVEQQGTTSRSWNSPPLVMAAAVAGRPNSGPRSS